jgi:hypothetical protein
MLVLGAVACGDDGGAAGDTSASDGGTTSDTGDPGPIPARGGADLLAWLEAGGYRSWPRESAAHVSRGPHRTEVITYLSPELDASLAAGQTSHPLGAAAVKEAYTIEGELVGWDVGVKVDGAGVGPAAWWWYERINGVVMADDQGNAVCASCHGMGVDTVLTEYPLP